MWTRASSKVVSPETFFYQYIRSLVRGTSKYFETIKCIEIDPNISHVYVLDVQTFHSLLTKIRSRVAANMLSATSTERCAHSTIASLLSNRLRIPVSGCLAVVRDYYICTRVLRTIFLFGIFWSWKIQRQWRLCKNSIRVDSFSNILNNNLRNVSDICKTTSETLSRSRRSKKASSSSTTSYSLLSTISPTDVSSLYITYIQQCPHRVQIISVRTPATSWRRQFQLRTDLVK
ncbi:unnamed protein product [Trichogramma brassicae]|uniref:Uncharacterized protein n=1 Tax=Trichogramma brassicae TaxID=86971 RepID=A0A6H5J749_9HYME|nr:unnamed protein product [Trichogramma brassicae]